MSTTVDLPARFVTFPARCFVCRRAPETSRLVAATKGMHIGGTGYSSSVEVRVPLCQADAAHIRGTRALAMTLLFLAFLGLAAWFFFYGLDHDSTVSVVFGAMLFLGAPFALHSVMPQLLDQWLIGVAGVTHRDRGVTVRLVFRDDAAAGEVAELTAARRNGRTPPAEAAVLRQQEVAEAGKKRMSPRMIAFFFVLGSIVMLAIDQNDVQEKGKFSPMLAFFSPLVLVVALGAMVDPRLPFAMGKFAPGLPPRIRLAGRLIALCGAIAGGALLFFRLT
jgi:hypothetical protein